MKKVIVISTSLRTGSNSDMLADRFIDGALQAGHEVEKISLIGKNIQFCRGCLACQKLGRCVIKDDVDAIMQKVLHADVIVWATPIYYFEMSGQMKVLIDRMNALYNLDYPRRIYADHSRRRRTGSSPTRRGRSHRLDRLFPEEPSGRYIVLWWSDYPSQYQRKPETGGSLRNGTSLLKTT